MTVTEVAVRGEKFLERWSGWGQLIFTVIAWTTALVWNARGLQDATESNSRILQQHIDMESRTTQQLAMQLNSVSDKVLQLSMSLERLSAHEEAIDNNVDRRIERVERTQDGHK